MSRIIKKRSLIQKKAFVILKARRSISNQPSKNFIERLSLLLKLKLVH